MGTFITEVLHTIVHIFMHKCANFMEKWLYIFVCVNSTCHMFWSCSQTNKANVISVSILIIDFGIPHIIKSQLHSVFLKFLESHTYCFDLLTIDF